MSGELRLQISEEGADAERLVALTGFLRAEFLQLDVANVAVSQSGEANAGVRGDRRGSHWRFAGCSWLIYRWPASCW